jgi:hypothetical protein
MDTAELLAAVDRRVAETVRDRDRLLEAVAALDDEARQLQDEIEVLSRIISRFAGEAAADEGSSATTHEGSNATTDTGLDAATEPGSDERTAADDEVESTILWPAGRGFDRPLKAKKARSWANYKMEAADWYLDTLLAMSLQQGRLERVLGVEMAVEGVIQSLCSAFEVMICALTQAIEKAAGVPADRRTPRHLVNWSRLAAAAKVFDIDLASTLSISAALLGEHSEDPQGPLAQLFALRRHAAVQDPLLKAVSRDGGDAELLIDVPGRGPLPLVDYLFEARNLVGELLGTILHDVADANAGRLYIPASNELRERAEQGLGVILAPDGLLAS